MKQQATISTSIAVLPRLMRWLAQKKEEGAAFALWKLPHQNTVYVLADTDYVRQKERIFELEHRRGFLFEGFEDAEKGFFLHGDGLLKFQLAEELQLISDEPADWPQNERHPDPTEALNENLFRPYTRKNAGGSATVQSQYEASVREAISAIASGSLDKVVPARLHLEKLPEHLDIISLFLKAARRYPNTMVSLVSMSEAGTWLGATPEILVAQDAQGIFQTVALAGTQYLGDKPIKSLSWTQKEIEEQAMVSRYIINCFKQIRLREFTELGPKTSQSGKLAHLKTEFRVDTIAERYPQLASVMLRLLHPTSAVCGMPKAAALDFLHEYEHFPRQFFSGYLGPVNLEGQTLLFVNLRCMQVLSEHLAFYAGAGITEDSDPRAEWLETEMKIKTMRDLLESY